MKKKVGIITIHNSPNYGACLQSYALFKFIEQNGYECELINLLRPYHAEYKTSKRFTDAKNRSNKNVIKRILKKFIRINRKEDHESRMYALKYKEEHVKREKAFNEFNSSVKLSPKYVSIDELYDNPPLYDVYVSGSDQIWNPFQPYCLEPYFLTFPVGKGKKISYASSIGITHLPLTDEKNFSEWLSDYTWISVREREAQELISRLVDKKVSLVMDPTFLLGLEHWRNLIIEPEIKEKYIFCFTLNYNPVLLEYSKKIARQAGLKLIIIGHCLQDTGKAEYISVLSAGPKEWLGLIKNAELVITESFHGTVFSIMLSQNFVSYIGPLNKRGSRITNLLETFGLESHLLNNSLAQDYPELSGIKMNREKLDREIELKTVESKEYLLESLSC